MIFCLAGLCYTASVLDFLTRFPYLDYRGLLAVGLVLGLALAVLRGRRAGLPAAVLVDGTLAAALGGLLLGRAVYVAAQWTYFRHSPGEALALWRGGLSAPGVLAGGLLAVAGWAALRRVDGRRVLDVMAPGAALLVVCAWLACLGNGVACGVESRPDQGLLWSLSAELPDLYGLRAPRVAVQALGALWGGVVLALLLARCWRRPFPLWLLLYAGGDFALAFWRGDTTAWLAGLSAVHVADVGLAVVGWAMLVWPLDVRRQTVSTRYD